MSRQSDLPSADLAVTVKEGGRLFGRGEERNRNTPGKGDSSSQWLRPHRKARQRIAAPPGKVASLAAEMDDPERSVPPGLACFTPTRAERSTGGAIKMYIFSVYRPPG